MTNAKKSHEKPNQTKSDTIINKLSKASREVGLLSPERENEVQGIMFVDNCMYGLFDYIERTKQSRDKYHDLFHKYNDQWDKMKEEADSLGKQTGVVDYDVKEQSEHYENIYLDVSERLARAEMIKSHLDEIICVPILGRVYSEQDYEITKKRIAEARKKNGSGKKTYQRVKLS